MKRVLIIKTSSMGDIIHTLPALTDAASAIPDIQFDWVVEENFAEIPAWHPAVNHIIPVAIRRWRKSILKTLRSGEWAEFRQNINNYEYDAVIDAQGLLKSAWITKKARGATFGLDKHSAREPLASYFYQHPQAISWQQHAVERIRQLFAQSLGYTVPTETGKFALNHNLFENSYSSHTPYIVFIHGTTWATKHWPENYWRKLTQPVVSAGYSVLLPWGNEIERARAEQIAKDLDFVTVLPKLSLAAIAGVLSGATAAVAVDTGLGHLAAAMDIPCVSLYGPTSPDKIGAYGADQVHLTLDQCSVGEHPASDPEIFTPMTAEFVWQHLSTLLDKST